MKLQVIHIVSVLTIFLSAPSSFTYGLLSPSKYVDTGSSALIKTVTQIIMKTLKTGEAVLMVDPIEAAIIEPPNNCAIGRKRGLLNITHFEVGSKRKFYSFIHCDRSLINFSIYHASCPYKLDKILKRIKYHSVNDPSRNTILIDVSTKGEEILPTYFKVLWENGYIKTIILKLRPGTTTTVDLYQWDPLEPIANCGLNTSTYKKIGTSYFPINSPKNFYMVLDKADGLFNSESRKTSINCTLKVGVVIYPPFVIVKKNEIINPRKINLKNGFEVKLIKVIAQHLKINVSFQVSKLPLDWGSIQENGSASGIFKDLMTGKADVGISSFTYTQREMYIDFGPPYAYEHLMWCVPEPRYVEPWTKLLYPFGRLHALMYCVAVILTSVVLWLFSRIRKNEPKYNKKFLNCFFRTIADFYSNTYAMHRPRSSRIKLFQIVWLFFTIHVSVLYSGKLFALLTFDTKFSPFRDLEDIWNSDLKLQIMSSTKHYLMSGEANKLIPREYTTCTNISQCLEGVSVAKDSALCLSESTIQYINADRLDINCLKKATLVSFPITMAFRKRYYFFSEIKPIITNLFETGLIQHWKKKATELHSKHDDWKTPSRKFDWVVQPPKTEKPITIENLRAAFVMLFNGYFIATVVFFVELVWSRISIYRNNRLYFDFTN